MGRQSRSHGLARWWRKVACYRCPSPLGRSGAGHPYASQYALPSRVSRLLLRLRARCPASVQWKRVGYLANAPCRSEGGPTHQSSLLSSLQFLLTFYLIHSLVPHPFVTLQNSEGL